MVHEAVLPRLKALDIDPERPLLAVDVDEVIVGLAAHLAEFAEEGGYRLELTSYQLDGALKRKDGTLASDREFRTLFDTFFETQTRHQRVYPDAAAVLDRISARTQVVILTNVPPFAEEARIGNLRGHGIDFPLVVNAEGKGRTMAWLCDRTGGPVAFIDDSPGQIGSVAKHAPEVTRLHFVGDPNLRALIGPVDKADHAPSDWLEIEAILSDLFAP